MKTRKNEECVILNGEKIYMSKEQKARVADFLIRHLATQNSRSISPSEISDYYYGAIFIMCLLMQQQYYIRCHFCGRFRNDA